MPHKMRQWFERTLASADIRLDGSRPWDISLHDEPGVVQRVLAQGSLGFGDAYVDGLWDCGKLDEMFTHLLSAHLESKVKPNLALLTYTAKAKLLNMQTRRRSRKVAQIHYDLGNDFYESMLDPWMQYTCAYYGGGAQDLNAAQEAKLEMICRKINLKEGDEVLELGCGWGGFGRYAATHYGAHVTAYNISKEQVEYAREHAKGLPVEYRLADYREATGCFDKAVSVGMCEHVGPKNYHGLMKLVHSCLKPHGVFLLHTIGGNYEVADSDLWLDRHIFPGSVLPSPVGLARAFGDYFTLEDWHNLGVDYDRTLLAWDDNFQSNWPRFREQYGDKFFRMWHYYLMVSAGSFRSRKNQLWQLVLSKDGVMGGWKTVR